MFPIVCDPSSGSIELYLNEIIRSGSQMFVVCVHGTTGWELVPSQSYRTHTARVQNYAVKHTTNTCEPLRIISFKYSSILPDDGSHTIRNMLE